ncbi:AraC family transcriptional regulator [Comamonas testosteroni ATCC 11996]|nr:AraC family transcriptional regulator [Comamonas testosteroni ATCC 11996]
MDVRCLPLYRAWYSRLGASVWLAHPALLGKLLESGLPQVQVAENYGDESERVFAHAFKCWCGLPPRAYQRKKPGTPKKACGAETRLCRPCRAGNRWLEPPASLKLRNRHSAMRRPRSHAGKARFALTEKATAAEMPAARASAGILNLPQLKRKFQAQPQSVMRRQFVAQIAHRPPAFWRLALEFPHLVDQQIDLLLLTVDRHIELFEQILGVAGLDLQLHDSLLQRFVTVAHALSALARRAIPARILSSSAVANERRKVAVSGFCA